MSGQDAQWPAELKLQKYACQSTQVYSDNDYMSGDGIQTAIFGPVFWAAIHMVSFNYPPHPSTQQKQQYENWLRATGNILPCKYCRDNFESNLQAACISKEVFHSRDSFSRFCYRLHSEVNRMLGKPTNVTFEQVRAMYEGFRSRCLTEAQKAQLANNNHELGCVFPAHKGTKGKCVISVIPANSPPADSFQVSDACRLHRTRCE